MVIIQHKDGSANKDLDNFARQIDSLSDKWQK